MVLIAWIHDNSQKMSWFKAFLDKNWEKMVFITFFISCRSVPPSLKNGRMTWQLPYVLKSCNLQQTKNCTSFGLTITLFLNTFCTNIQFQKIPQTFNNRFCHFACLRYSFKNHHLPHKGKWSSLFTCKNCNF